MDFYSEIQTTIKRTLLTMTTKLTGSKAAATKMTKTLKLLKMQKFMFLMILMVISNAAVISAKTADEKAAEKQILDMRNKCITSSKLTKDQVKLIDEHELFTKYTTLANTPKEIQCYNACYMEGLGLFANGKPNEKVLRATLPELIPDKKKADAFWNKCMKLEGKNKCEIAFNFVLCGLKEAGLDV